MFSIELHEVKFSAETVADVIALVRAFKSSSVPEGNDNSNQPCITNATNSGVSSKIFSQFGKVTINAADSATHAFSTVAENALPLVGNAACMILDKTAVLSECLGDNLYRLARASKTASAARQSIRPAIEADAVGHRSPSSQEAVIQVKSPSDERQN